MFKNALVSVSDKTGLEHFLRPFIENGLRVVSSGGTAQYLKEKGFEVVSVSEQTHFPEVMGGRVKTLHPHIHMPLLQRPDQDEDQKILAQYGLEPFDLVIVNLYPFEEALKKNMTESEMIEFIDIGGPTLLRAAAKNFNSVTVLCDPQDYPWIQESKETTLEDRKKLATKVFERVSSYDQIISSYLLGESESFKKGKIHKTLRYGENPQQQAQWFANQDVGLQSAKILQGKELSYNNLLDLDAALSTLALFPDPTVVSVKHNNPCGVASSSSITTACEKSLSADPMSVFGGIVAFNREVDAECANKLVKIFLECVIAPGMTEEAKEILRVKRNLRLLIWPDLVANSSFSQKSFRSVLGGYLAQSPDEVGYDFSKWKTVSGEINEADQKALLFAWRVCSALKSNAIAVTSETQTLGLGMGQVNRVDAVEQALSRTLHFHPNEKLRYLASDAFFPFPDSIEKAAERGVRAIIQPGGSIKDDDVIARAKEYNIPMVFTGVRHFRH